MYLSAVTAGNNKRGKVHEHDTQAGLCKKDQREITASPVATVKAGPDLKTSYLADTKTMPRVTRLFT